MITEYTIVQRAGKNGPFNTSYMLLKIGDELYYAGHSIEGIKTVKDEELASRFSKESDVGSIITDLKKFFNDKGNYISEQ